MAFQSVCYEEDIKNMSSEEFKKWFCEYCNWCWGHGYGSCKVCNKYKNHLLLQIKLREFKE